MKCLLCRQADTRPGSTTLTLKRAGATAVVKRVPAQVCPNCGEAYVSEAETARAMTTAEKMLATDTLVDVRQPQSA